MSIHGILFLFHHIFIACSKILSKTGNPYSWLNFFRADRKSHYNARAYINTKKPNQKLWLNFKVNSFIGDIKIII